MCDENAGLAVANDRQLLVERLRNAAIFTPFALEIWVRSGFHCEYCDADLLASLQAWGFSQSDHILPACEYPALKDSVTNFAQTCGFCNQLKRNWDPANGDPSFANASSLTCEQRDVLIKRCRERLKGLLDAEQQKIDQIKSFLKQ